ncbi:VOC family protein [Cryptosporangium sp. NPDC048952]|uniref:VOC family protein n=1 Tax=Cryptosporangium sp. NPDC048952 TaxID=3363961 RepID=UPI00371B0DCD
MVSRLAQVNVKVRDPAASGRFWAAALGWEAFDGHGTSVRPAGTGWPVPGLVCLDFIPVPDPGTVRDRAHLELATTSPAQHAELLTHLTTLGATPVAGATVLADPDGAVFCVPEPRAEYGDTGPIAAIVVDCADPRALAAFWGAALGWTIHEATDEVARLRANTGPWLEFHRASHVGDAFNRAHLDLLPSPVDAQSAEVARLRGLGATPENLDDYPWTVLADPEGNEFCVLG